MLRHRIDMSEKFSVDRYKNLPDNQQIENPEVEPVPKKDPPQKLVEREPYLAGETLVTAVNLAIALGRPLLLQGDPGCGKTRLAYAVAYALRLPLEECYIKSTSRAQDLLYSYDAVKRLYDVQLGADGPKEEDGQPLCRDPRNYVSLGPLGRAIARAQYGRRSVVLIDEIDKADIDFPNDLLLELDRLEFRVAEAPDMHYAAGDHPELRPIVFVTHNEEKALPTAFLRRCIFHYLEFPHDEALLQRILAIHHIAVESKALGQRAIEVLLSLRSLDLNKKPGLSELIDWVGYLEAVKTPVEELDALPYLGVLLKQQADQHRAGEGSS
jgi:MoxR-like ATPase